MPRRELIWRVYLEYSPSRRSRGRDVEGMHLYAAACAVWAGWWLGAAACAVWAGWWLGGDGILWKLEYIAALGSEMQLFGG
eukprot:gene10866-biopygen5263